MGKKGEGKYYAMYHPHIAIGDTLKDSQADKTRALSIIF